MKLKTILLATALVSGVPALASAQEATTSVNIGVASAYQFRGVNQNIEDTGQYFGGIDVSAGSFYVGTWVSNVDFDTKANLEVDLYAGFKPKLGPVQFDIGVLTYMYPQETALNIWEGKVSGTVTAESGAAFTGSVFYSPEYGKDGPSYWYYEAAVSLPIPGAKVGPFALSASASIGAVNAETNTLLPDYTNYKIGLTAATENGWAVDLFYTDTDVDNNKLYEGKGVVQLKRTF